MDLRILFPVLQVVSDFSKAMIRDDQKDLAFPTRHHRGMIHHYQLGLITFPFAELAMKLIDVYEIVKTEPFKKGDTPGTFLQRVVSIHNKTYTPPQEDDEQRRISLLSEYFQQLRSEPANRTKKDIQHKIEKAIYMGKIKTKTQLDAELRRRKKSMHPPRINKPRASQGKIMLSKSNFSLS